MKKIHDQLNALVSAPPSSTPAAPPLPEAAPQIPSARLRRGPPRTSSSGSRAPPATSSAAPSPCSERKAISEASDQASPSSSELTVNSDQAGHEEPPAAEQVGQPAAEQEHAAEEDRVGGDHPLQALLAEVQVVLDRRQRDVHDRDIEHDHELGGDDHREGEPAAPVAVPGSGQLPCFVHSFRVSPHIDGLTSMVLAHQRLVSATLRLWRYGRHRPSIASSGRTPRLPRELVARAGFPAGRLGYGLQDPRLQGTRAGRLQPVPLQRLGAPRRRQPQRRRQRSPTRSSWIAASWSASSTPWRRSS